jgi:type IV secretion system protein VirB7
MKASPKVRLASSALIALALAGCTTFSGQAPSCDGMSRRPLNRSMWDWERGLRDRAPALTASSGGAKTRPAPAGAGQGAAASGAARASELPSPALPSEGAGIRTAPGGQARIDVAASHRACGTPGEVRHG